MKFFSFFISATIFVFFSSGCVSSGAKTTRSLANSSLEYQVLLSDPDNILGSDRAIFLENFRAAMSDWGQFIRGNGELIIKIQFDSNTPGGHFDTISPNMVFIREENGLNIYDMAGTYKLRTGHSAKDGEPDILIRIQPEYFLKYCWIDPKPDRRIDPVPKDHQDLITLFAHELGHGFGIDGFRNPVTGSLSDAKMSVYDSLILDPNSNRPFFGGVSAQKVYGGMVPLSRFRATDKVFLHYHGTSYVESKYASQSFYHYGRFADNEPESDLTFYGLMASVWLYRNKDVGLRLRVSRLDAAIVHDLGVPTLINF